MYRHIVINIFYRNCDSPLKFLTGPTHVHFPLTLLENVVHFKVKEARCAIIY